MIRRIAATPSALDAKFAADRAAMRLNGLFTDIKLVGDLFIEQSERYLASDHFLALRQRIEIISGRFFSLFALMQFTAD